MCVYTHTYWSRSQQPTPALLPGESPWTEEPGRLLSMRLQRVRHNWSDLACTHNICTKISSVQSLSRVWLFVTPWIAAHQASLSITNSQSSLRLTSIESVMPSSHLILCHPLHLFPPIPPSIRVFSNESTLRMRWPKYWSFSLSIFLPKKSQGWSPSEWTELPILWILKYYSDRNQLSFMSLNKYSISVESFKNLDQLHKLRRNFLHFISDSFLYKIYYVHYYIQDSVIENFYIFPLKWLWFSQKTFT